MGEMKSAYKILVGNPAGKRPFRRPSRRWEDNIQMDLKQIGYHWRAGDRPDDGGTKHLWNVGKLLPDYMAQQPRRQPSSYSPPWEPESHLVRIACNPPEIRTWNFPIAEHCQPAWWRVFETLTGKTRWVQDPTQATSGYRELSET
jgi:hypothetical protein